jgi:hypothetical protein
MESRIISLETVIKGLKFVAENQDLEYKEYITKLRSIIGDYNLEDFSKQFPGLENEFLFYGLASGSLGAGASILINILYSSDLREYVNEKFLSVDDEYSIYNYIRLTTKENYTKEMVDKINQSKKSKGHKILPFSKVIEALKYIAENKHVKYEEFIIGLRNIVDNYSFEDFLYQFPDVQLESIFNGLSNGSLSAGVGIIVNVLSSSFNRDFVNEKFLGIDDKYSIYHFIRITTGENYTKNMIDSNTDEMVM